MADDLLVSVIDDDESVRESIPDLLRTFGFHVRAFKSAEAFLASDVIEVTKCVVLDVAMPGMTGPELFEQLKRRPKAPPVIFITAQRNGDICQHLVAQGAAACLHKPFDPMALVEAVKLVVPYN